MADVDNEIKTLVSLKYKIITSNSKTWTYANDYPYEVKEKWIKRCLNDLGFSHVGSIRILDHHILVEMAYIDNAIRGHHSCAKYVGQDYDLIFNKYVKWLIDELCKWESRKSAIIEKINI
jgi:hypothetical protein